MKKLFFIILLYSITVLPQNNYSQIYETDILVGSPAQDYVDIFTNHLGNNIIVHNLNTDEIKYYLMDLEGNATLRNTFSNAAGFPAQITGDEEKLFIAYTRDNELKILESTDGGESWVEKIVWGSGSASSFSVFNDGNGLHIVFQVNDDCKYINYESGLWRFSQVFSDGLGSQKPKVTSLYPRDKVYVSFEVIDAGNRSLKYKQLDLSSGTPVWSSATTVELFDDQTMWWSEEIGVGIRQSTQDIWVHFPYYFYHDTPARGLHIDYKIVTMWPDFPGISQAETHINTEEVKIHPTTDADLRTHYLKSFQNWSGPNFPNTGLVHFYLEEITGWEYYNIFSNFEYLIYSHPNASASSNDVHFIWKDASASNPDVLYYMYLDEAPLAPTNLTSYLDSDPDCYNCHEGSGFGIKLDWDKNKEADLSHYIIYGQRKQVIVLHVMDHLAVFQKTVYQL